MTFYSEEREIAQRHQARQELEQLLRQLKSGETKVRILEYARRQRKSVGVFVAYHPEKDFRSRSLLMASLIILRLVSSPSF